MKFCKQVALSAACAILATAAYAQTPSGKFSDNVIRIGVMNDRSGLYADLSGEGSAVGARMAAEEFGNKVLGVPVEIITADHQNKTDIGLSIARKWFDADGVDVIVDISNSAVSLALNGLVKDRKKLILHNSASADLTGKGCAARSIQWQYSVYSAASKVVTPKMIADGMKTFYIIAVDYAMGESISSVFKKSVEKMGGKVVGEVRHPLNSADMSSYLLQAKASGAKAIMLANAGTDLGTSVRQAREYGITPGATLLAAALTTDVIASNGMDVMQGVQMLSQFDMYRSQLAIDWLKKFATRHGGKTPTSLHAASYSSVLHYLKAIAAAGTDDVDAVLAKLKEMTINDAFASNGKVRDDGVMSHDMYLSRVKAAKDSKGPGDFFNVVDVLPGEVANLPLAESDCPLIKK